MDNRFILFHSPYNIILVIIYAAFLLFLHLKFRKNKVILWLADIPAAIISIIFFGVLYLIPLIITQDSNLTTGWYYSTGLSHIKNSYASFLIEINMLTVLGLVTLKRNILLKGANFGFFLMHAGLWIIIVSGIAGVGDLEVLKINLLKDDDQINIAINENGEVTPLPFGIRLIDLKMDFYSPRITLLEETDSSLNVKRETIYPRIDSHMSLFVSDWYVQVKQYKEHTFIKDSILQVSDENGNYPAAFIQAFNPKSYQILSGWISSGSFLQKPLRLSLQNQSSLFLAKQDIKNYSVTVAILGKNSALDTVRIAVNHPFKIGGWKIHLVGYDTSKGKSSNLCILEAVKDPWLPVVYVGGFLMIAGVGVLFAYRRKIWIG